MSGVTVRDVMAVIVIAFLYMRGTLNMHGTIAFVEPIAIA